MLTAFFLYQYDSSSFLFHSLYRCILAELRSANETNLINRIVGLWTVERYLQKEKEM